ncbi:MAG: citrate (Si)-synthase, partial [Proteobacteria bacterium]|nr:citrate (Si)-synthase [Pseudomonadota bacterium]
MNECTPVLNTGLRGIQVASSKICDVLGKQGKLIYRGYSIEGLAEKANFEEICFLLLYERLPQKKELADFDQSLKNKRRVPENLFGFLRSLPQDTNPMDVLQMATPLLMQTDANAGKEGMENTLFSAENLIAGIAILTAAWDRIRNNKDPIPPDDSLNHAANFLYMLKGEKPDKETAHFFDTCLVLHAEHSFNASTFTARQVASTKAHIYASISAAIGSLSGALHGGANVRVMEMLKQIGSIDKIDGYIKDILDKGGLIMGLGHAVYQTDDP